MFSRGVHDPWSADRRRWQRVRLSVPVQFGKGSGGEGRCLYFSAGHSSDLSTAGVYLTTDEPGPFIPGEALVVSVVVPWESRRAFPFSRIAGRGRVIRVEKVDTTAGTFTGLALSFLPEETSLLGSILTP